MFILLMHACLMTFGSSKIWVNPAIFKSFFQAGMILLIVIICVLQVEFEDTKGVIRIRISKKNRQHNGQMKKYKRANNDLQSIHIKQKIE
jgi:hypothetical protein